MEKEANMTARKGWRFEKAISLPVIIMFIVQTIGGAWVISSWQTKTDARLGYLETQLSATAWQAEKIIRLDEGVKNLQTGIGEIKTMIQQQQQNHSQAK